MLWFHWCGKVVLPPSHRKEFYAESRKISLCGKVLHQTTKKFEQKTEFFVFFLCSVNPHRYTKMAIVYHCKKIFNCWCIVVLSIEIEDKYRDATTIRNKYKSLFIVCNGRNHYLSSVNINHYDNDCIIHYSRLGCNISFSSPRMFTCGPIEAPVESLGLKVRPGPSLLITQWVCLC